MVLRYKILKETYLLSVWKIVISFYKPQEPMEWKPGRPKTETGQADE